MQTIQKEFEVEGLSKNCMRIFDNGTHVLLGISPFNSRFSQDYITRIIGWASESFSEVSILLAGKEASNLLEALGTPKTKADRKVRKEIRRHIRYSEEALKLHDKNIDSIHTFSDFENNKVYRETVEKVKYYFNADQTFRNACLSMSYEALTGRAKGSNLKSTEITTDMLLHSVKYVLAELPFFLSGASILGYDESVLAYHRPWELGEQIKNNNFALNMSENQGYIILKENEC
ncbi:cyclo(L-leucyl-L-leucyl) synthase [Siminovitchia terrae]|uniref:Cyclodipeptide synthase n=1 Tax=Siminovitchia terrae TaxID=1914933 RepID=A0ABQ4L1J4_SIMTE|nr:tRNA-dependent cyclodipeptide synthase [Siminovitchia terrae]GIN98089.1 cyclo(L-leucyl-L-leucyl) synthase [Siminovitchia terrae]